MINGDSLKLAVKRKLKTSNRLDVAIDLILLEKMSACDAAIAVGMLEYKDTTLKKTWRYT